MSAPPARVEESRLGVVARQTGARASFAGARHGAARLAQRAASVAGLVRERSGVPRPKGLTTSWRGPQAVPALLRAHQDDPSPATRVRLAQSERHLARARAA